MRALDILEYIRRQPFESFVLTLTDGRTYTVQHPELAMVGISTVVLGLPSQETRDPVFERTVTVSLQHIMQVELVESAASPPTTE